MEDTSRRWLAVAAVAPIAWGSTYYVTHAYLPDAPLWGAAIRALPAAVLLLALARRLPRGAWWWRSAVLGVLNVGAFFVLVFVAAQRLPTSVAATIMAASSITIALAAWAIVGERPTAARLGLAGVGVGGVALMVLTATTGIDAVGVAASVGAMLMSSCGYALAKRWTTADAPEGPALAPTAWQLAWGGLLLLPVAALVEGSPPALDGPAVLGFAYQTLVATALAFVCWFAALQRLRSDTVGLIGLLNPATGVVLGVLVAGEVLGSRQWLGLALVVAAVALGALLPTRRPAASTATNRVVPREPVGARVDSGA